MAQGLKVGKLRSFIFVEQMKNLHIQKMESVASFDQPVAQFNVFKPITDKVLSYSTQLPKKLSSYGKKP